MDINNLIKNLDDLHQVKSKISEKKTKEYQKLLKELLVTEIGRNEILNRLRPEIKLPRFALRILVKEIDDLLYDSEDQVRRDLFELLEQIINKDKVDSDARWRALSIYLCLDLPQGLRLLKEVTSEYSDLQLPDIYEKYLLKDINPDGGLPFLLKLIEREQSFNRLAPTIGRVALYLKENDRPLDKTTIFILENYLRTWVLKAKGFEVRLLELVLLAAQSISDNNDLKRILQQLYPFIIEKVKKGEIVEDGVIKELAKALDIQYEEMPPTETVINNQNTGQEIRTFNELADAQRLSGSFMKLKDTVGSLSFILNKIQKQIFAYELIEVENSDLKIKVHRLEAELSGIKKERDNLILELQRVDKQIGEVKGRCLQDIKIAQKNAQYTLDTFRHQLWEDLRASLIEAMESSYPMESLPINERIYLGRLRRIVQVLKDHKVIKVKD